MTDRSVLWKLFPAVITLFCSFSPSLTLGLSLAFFFFLFIFFCLHLHVNVFLFHSQFPTCLSFFLFSPRTPVDQCQQDAVCPFLLRLPKFFRFIVASWQRNYLLLSAIFQQLPREAELRGWSFRGNNDTFRFSYVRYYSVRRWQMYIFYRFTRMYFLLTLVMCLIIYSIIFVFVLHLSHAVHREVNVVGRDYSLSIMLNF